MSKYYEELKETQYALYERDDYGTEVVGYSDNKTELEKLAKALAIDEYSRQNDCVYFVDKICKISAKMDILNDLRFVNYDSVVCEIPLDKKLDTKGFGAYFKDEPRRFKSNVLESEMIEEKRSPELDYKNNMILVRYTTSDQLSKLDDCREYAKLVGKMSVVELMNYIESN